MKKILSVLFIITLFSCNSGGGEKCCSEPRDSDCNGICDNCNMSGTPGETENPCNTKLLVEHKTVKDPIKPLEMEYFGVRKVSYDNGNTWTVKK